ncbi:hypothetical protein EV1_001533 [Malus domestica]
MTCPSNICLDLSLRSDTNEQRQDNIWHPSFLSSNGPLTVEGSVMKNNITATVVARNLLTPKDRESFQNVLTSWPFKTSWLSVFNVRTLYSI